MISDSVLAGRYVLRGEIGRGGMGIVYRAHDPHLDRDVAVKLIPSHLLTEESEQRFRREARVVARMDHPAIVAVFDFGRHREGSGDQKSLFLVMPLIEGVSLRDRLRAGSSGLAAKLEIVAVIAEALAYSHARGVVHRDVKPENVMLSQEMGQERVRVMDFGLARVLADKGLTQTGAMIGTVNYMSPELVDGKPFDGKTDVFSLGAVFYECLAGRPPFLGNIVQVLRQISDQEPPDWQAQAQLGELLSESVLARLDGLVRRCLAKEPERRPTAAELAFELAEVRGMIAEGSRPEAAAHPIAPSPAFDRRQAERPPPLVGREKQIAELAAALDRLARGELQLFFVSGLGGVGKSRLLEAFEELAQPRDLRVLHGRFSETASGFPYQGFFEILQESLRSSLPPDLSGLRSPLIRLFPLLAEVLPFPQMESDGTRRAGSASSIADAPKVEEIYELFARALLRIGQGEPLVLLFEDLHRADASLKALRYVVPRLRLTPTLILATFRTEEVDRRHALSVLLRSLEGHRSVRRIPLEALDLERTASLVAACVGESRLSPELPERVFDAARGNPFFTVELVRSLLESKRIAPDSSGAWRWTDELGDGPLPVTIREAVEERLDRLPRGAREVASVASVLGKAFDVEALEELVPERLEPELEDLLDELLKLGVVRERRRTRGDVLAFSSGLVRDALYARLPRRRRRRLHRRFAENLERRHGSRVDRYAGVLAHHFSQGDAAAGSVRYGLISARQALAAFSPEEALRSARIVLDFVDDQWDGSREPEAEARALTSRALGQAGQHGRALAAAEEARELYSRLEPPPAGPLLALALHAAQTAWQARRTGEAEIWVRRGLEIARSLGAKPELLQLLGLGATLAGLKGESRSAQGLLREIDALRGTGPRSVGSPERRSGGRLVVGFANRIQALDPAELSTDEELEIAGNVYETLIASEEGGLRPGLAERWQMSADGRRIELDLRPATLHDGSSLTAEAVIDAAERTVRRRFPETPWAAVRGARELWSGEAARLAGARAAAPLRLELDLADELPIYPVLLTCMSAAVAVESNGRLNGTGPFTIASRDEQTVVLRRFSEHWSGPEGGIEEIEFRCGIGAGDCGRQLRSRTLDLVRDLRPEDLEDYLADPIWRQSCRELTRNVLYFAAFNEAGPAALGVEARRSLCRGVEPSDLVWQTLGRLAIPAPSLIPPRLLGHDPEAGARRPVAAGSRRSRASGAMPGLSAAVPLELRGALHPVLADRYAPLVESLLERWGELGVSVSFGGQGMDDYLEALRLAADPGTGEPLDLILGRWAANYEDPDSFTLGLFHSATGIFRAWFSSQELDRLMESGRRSAVPRERQKIYRQAERTLRHRAIVQPLFYEVDCRPVAPSIQGLRLQSTAPYVSYAEIFRDESRRSRVSGSTIRVPMTARVDSLDPALVGTVEQAEVVPNLFETLTRDLDGATIVPWLASRLEPERRGARYRVRLRKGVRFHDGRTLTAHDVRYSFERMLCKTDAQGRHLFQSVVGARELADGRAEHLAGFRIQDPRSFVIDLEAPLGFFPALLTHLAAAVLPLGHEPEAGEAIGTGPFRLLRFVPGQRLELEASAHYWRPSQPRTQHLVFRFGRSPEEILEGFSSGAFHLATDLFPADVEQLRRDVNSPSFYQEAPRLSTYFAVLRSETGPLKATDVRARLHAAIPTATLVSEALGRLAIPARGLIPPGLPGSVLRSATSQGEAEFSGDASRRVRLSTVLHPVFHHELRDFAVAFRRVVGRAGFDLEVADEEREGGWDRVFGDADVDLVLARWIADYPDPDTFVRGLLDSREGYLGRYLGSPELDELAARGSQESDPVLRRSYYEQAEEILRERGTFIPLFHEKVYRFGSGRLSGFEVTMSKPVVPYERLELGR